jgi:alpha-ketoglutaric semialdehyde dehydrogenase
MMPATRGIGRDDVHANLIGGEWLEGPTAVLDRNPSDLADVVGEFAQADEAQVDAAIAAAEAAAPVWAAATPQERFTALETIGLELATRSAELGELLSREEGKPRAEGVGEVLRASQIFRFFAGEALRVGGEHVRSVRPGVDVDILREPLGVVGLITPWNFPIAIPAWKIAPALAFGCTVVCKPAELVPASAWALAEIVSRAGLPTGAFNLVVGPGRVVGERLLADPRVRGVSFTGSQAVGARVAQTMAARFGKYQLEMGGKNPLVILDDADLDVAVDCAVQGAFFQTGQRCTASSRLIVTTGIHDAFVEATIARMRTLRVGHALADDTEIGPVVSEEQLTQDVDYLAIGAGEGATLASGGERLERETDGYYLQPALLTDTTNDMRVNREEIFGPVATVLRADDAEHALALANDTEFGLSAGVVTTSLRHAARFRDGLQAGIVTINLPTAGVDFHVPFGGTKGSSSGTREQGRYAVEFYTTVKTAYVKP